METMTHYFEEDAAGAAFTEHLTDAEFFAEQRDMMRAAFRPTHPALVTMFWQNRETHAALCRHEWQCGEDGWVCRRCIIAALEMVHFTS
jgi:hypothetical protein